MFPLLTKPHILLCSTFFFYSFQSYTYFKFFYPECYFLISCYLQFNLVDSFKLKSANKWWSNSVSSILISNSLFRGVKSVEILYCMITPWGKGGGFPYSISKIHRKRSTQEQMELRFFSSAILRRKKVLLNRAVWKRTFDFLDNFKVSSFLIQKFLRVYYVQNTVTNKGHDKIWSLYS